MIVLDPRIGSGDLEGHLRSYDEDVRVKHMDFGDAWFWGNGVDGPVKIGVERKVLGDLVSSMRSNRLSGFQLPGLLQTYKWVYLVVEGIYRVGQGGIIEIHAGRSRRRGQPSQWTPLAINGKPILFREVDHYLATLEHHCGLTVVYTSNREETAAWIVSRYKWWQKDWDKHDSFRAVYAPYEHILPARRGLGTPKTVPEVAKLAAQLPGVSKKAFEFSKRFETPRQFMKWVADADIKELQEIEGVGRKGALIIFNWLRGERS